MRPKWHVRWLRLHFKRMLNRGFGQQTLTYIYKFWHIHFSLHFLQWNNSALFTIFFIISWNAVSLYWFSYLNSALKQKKIDDFRWKNNIWLRIWEKTTLIDLFLNDCEKKINSIIKLHIWIIICTIKSTTSFYF